MKRLQLPILAFVVVAVAATVTYVWLGARSPERQRDQAVEEFITVLPASLQDYHIEEIRGLFERFFTGASEGKVATEDVNFVIEEMHRYTSAGAITIKELDKLMAEVGYRTFKSVERMNLPDGVVDHPVLNPEAGMVQVGPDSAFWADFNKWKEARADSIAGAEKSGD